MLGKVAQMPAAGWHEHGDHHRHVARDLRLGAIEPVRLMRPHRHLEEEHVHGGAEGENRPQSEIVSEGELSGLGKTVEVRDQRAIGERDRRVEQVRGDDRQAVGEQLLRGRKARL